MSSGKKRTVIKTTKAFTFVRQERPGKKTWFEIHLTEWSLGQSNTWEELKEVTNDLDAMFATKGTKKKPADFTWFFWKYEEADQLFTMANLKWST
jgi:hypothetical protein